MRGSKSKNAPIGSNELELFLKEVEKTLIDKVEHYYGDKEKRLKEAFISKNPSMRISSRNRDINLMMKLLKELSKVVIPTDKTNSFRVVERTDYVKWVEGHIGKNASQAMDLLTRLEDEVSKSEFLFFCWKIFRHVKYRLQSY